MLAYSVLVPAYSCTWGSPGFVIFFMLFVVVRRLSQVWLFATPWTTAFQTSLSFTVSQSLMKLKSIESVIPFNHLIFYYCLLFLPSIFPSIRVFPVSQFFAKKVAKSIGASASASVLSMNIQGWFPLGLTGLISLLSKELLVSNTTVWKHLFFSTQHSLWSNSHIHTWPL